MQEKKSQNVNFSSRLKSAIQTSGLKQKELAKRVGVSAVTLSRYCSGTQVPTNANLRLLAAEIGVSVAYLLGESDIVPLKPAQENLPSDDNINWEKRAKDAEERLARLENILRELFAFARIGQ